ncbi:MAG: class I SAM-dependent methyltransferase [Ktedonobacteraceae bacterium]|nr:class I SAM-dependent methyltransferase [Ktedonobacteraceae bacterium]
MRKSWDHFYQLTQDKSPSAGLVKAISLLGHTGEALDLGCGVGRDTRYLLAQGFQVTAVDREAKAIVTLASLSTPHLYPVQSTFEDFTFASYALINAHFALPFLQTGVFSTVFARLKRSLKPDGIFVGQFFGIHDTWNVAGNPMTFLTREQALAELVDLKIMEFEEEDADGETAEGTTKHWHVFHIIVCKHSPPKIE